MKDFNAILAGAGVTITDEQKATITKEFGENYKPIADWQNQVDKVTNLTEQLTTTKEDLKKFDGVDADGLKSKITELETKLAEKDKEYQSKIAERDFSEILKESITAAGGKNMKAVKALLDDKLEDLKKSKNQKEDIDAAIKALTEAEDSKFLFGEPETVVDKTDPIGAVKKPAPSMDGVEKAFLDKNPGMKLD